jgi:hypothetical protein
MRGYRNTPESFWRCVDKSGGPDACWPWTRARTKAGYGTTSYLGRSVYAHRLAYSLTFGGLEPGDFSGRRVLLHRCDNPRCCNPAHLRLGTQAENIRDRFEKARYRAKTSKRMLTPEQVAVVKRICQLPDDMRPSDRAVAELFGVSFGSITQIRRDLAYRYVEAA